MIFLPNAANVVIDPRKIGYILSDPGKSKFFKLHGFDATRPQELEVALRQHPLANPIAQVFVTSFGTKFTVRCSLRSPDGRNPCTLSCWQFDVGKIEAKLVTAYAAPP